MYERAGFLRVSILSGLALGFACDQPEPDDVEALEWDGEVVEDDEDALDARPDGLIIEEPVEELVGAPTCNGPHWCTSSLNPWYSWSAVAGAANYRFVLFKYVNGVEQQIQGSDVWGLGTFDSVNLQSNVLYRWKVKGEGPGGYDPGPYCGGGVGNYFYYDATCPW